MRIAYLDCFAGIAGDMMLGALIDAGVPASVLEEATAALGIGASLRVERVDRSGISCTKVHVLENGHLAENPQDTPSHEPQQQQTAATHSHHAKTQHLHKGGHAHPHTHDHPHTHEDHDSQAHTHASDEPHHEAGSLTHPHGHGRSLTDIRSLIESARLKESVKRLAVRTFELLGASEARIHHVPIEQIHFHEVGAVDAIVDIVASCAGIVHLDVGAWFCSALNVGGGMVQCAHGTFPVPAPATADLLRGVPTYSAHIQKELVTPTGAALVRALAPTYCSQPAMKVDRIGYGAGTRNPAGFPNVLRLSVGEQSSLSAAQPADTTEEDTVTVLETALDDCSPQLIAFVAEKALATGALDVLLTPVIMKKGRPGTLLTVLCAGADSDRMQQLLLRETTTLGVRIRQERRAILSRELVPVPTPYGTIRIKTGSHAGEERNLAPEFEDCREAAVRHQVPLKQVQQAAITAYGARRPHSGQKDA